METYPFIEVAMACSDVKKMEAFWCDMFGGKVIFRGSMMGDSFSRLVACGITFVFREDKNFKLPPGLGQEFNFHNHLGVRVRDIEAAVRELTEKGAQFALTPEMVRQFQQSTDKDAKPLLQTDYISPPLTAERIAAGEFRIDVAILVGPDNLWIELNEVKEPADTNWFPAAELADMA